ncbi:MAG: radical SAM protein [Gammaproteobacteria bacterium]|nr:radical SAM protein [Gammaproteobacteria bacterium]MCP4090095.1 radical SAM protein [Gammaproteobacteria bacterium]MCP4277015.1 radical SAM protein [Gammaproteobacteria bacterium]MCP4832762.1 radical SAM protein [Gammaproteobacteria bacterium]MCP4929955.1 radical SAM protein [Gammaproteobacteria bacterium]
MDGNLTKFLNCLHTATGAPRGYIEPHTLSELWFHTGTACNLTCPFCLEGSAPGDNRLNRITLSDVEPFMHEAVALDVKKFSFTGGEPFIVKDFVNILSFASSLKPCLVLTNGTDPLLRRLHQIKPLINQPHPITFRISIDWPDEQRHDKDRGKGTFRQSLQAITKLQKLGFCISLARQMEVNEDAAEIDNQFQKLLQANGYQGDIHIVAFPNFALPGTSPAVPDITENCMTHFQTAESRQTFMCAFSKMIIKKNGRMRVYACTLVDDDERYDQGANLKAALKQQVMLAHHRCYSCFAYGSSCSER